MYFSGALFLAALAVASQFEWVRLEKVRRLPAPVALSEIGERARERPLNVVLVVIDTLRADRLGAYGYSRDTSPNLDALAQRGVRFARVEAQSSWTKASMASLWSGFYPQRTRVQRFTDALPREARLPAEILSDLGYRTAGIWRNGWVANNFGFAQGFDLYFRPIKSRPTKTASVGNVTRPNPSAHPLLGTDLDVTDSAIEFLRGATQDPFLLYVHYMDVHQYVYADSSPNFGTDSSDIYDAAIHWVDRNVGMLVDAMSRQRLLETTLVVIASDHGEGFGEHGLEGHARSLHAETQWTPLLFLLPTALDKELVIEERVANVDIWPTILDLIDAPPIPRAEGRSLVPLMRDAAGLDAPKVSKLRNRPVFSQLDQSWGRPDDAPRPLAAAVVGEHRLLWRGASVARFELEGEPAVAIAARPDVDAAAAASRRLEPVARDFMERPAAWSEARSVAIDALQAAQLKALGYAFTVGGLEVERKPPQAP